VVVYVTGQVREGTKQSRVTLLKVGLVYAYVWLRITVMSSENRVRKVYGAKVFRSFTPDKVRKIKFYYGNSMAQMRSESVVLPRKHATLRSQQSALVQHSEPVRVRR
jgi:hypothetical protein